MQADLFIKKMPSVMKTLITREALDNRRSINQEAIALLEEALVHRVASNGKKRQLVEAMLERYAEPWDGAPPAADKALPKADPLPSA